MSHLPDEEPIYDLDIDGEDIELHRWNTSLFQFAGELACYDHVFIVTQDDEERQSGWYIFRTAEYYDKLVSWIKKNDLPAHTGMLEAAPMDVTAWNSHFLTDEMTFPEDWVEA